MSAVEELISIGSGPISAFPAVVRFDSSDMNASFENELQQLLLLKNGFYAFESALHVLPSSPEESVMTLRRWNSRDLWSFEYGELARNAYFFAEDAFGNQFCFWHGNVCAFDAETAEIKPIAPTIEAWAERVLRDYSLLTGYPLLHEWQLRNGTLPSATRLMPKIPFVLGGNYSVENIYALSAARSMRTRGNLARQLKDLPDGTQIDFRVVD